MINNPPPSSLGALGSPVCATRPSASRQNIRAPLDHGQSRILARAIGLDKFLDFGEGVSPSVAARIFIIEEFTLLRELIRDLVKSLPGHTVVGDSATLARGSEECLRHRPDVVILGWTLPDGTGDRLLRDVAPSLPDTRWLVLAAQDGGESVQTAIGLGAHGVLVKQSDLATFRQALARLVDGGSFYCPLSSALLLDFLRNRTRSNPDGLTDREVEVLRHFATGAPPKSIAEQLRISVKTVQNQLSSVRQKIGVQETAGLVRYAIRIGVA